MDLSRSYEQLVALRYVTMATSALGVSNARVEHASIHWDSGQLSIDGRGSVTHLWPTSRVQGFHSAAECQICPQAL